MNASNYLSQYNITSFLFYGVYMGLIRKASPLNDTKIFTDFSEKKKKIIFFI